MAERASFRIRAALLAALLLLWLLPGPGRAEAEAEKVRYATFFVKKVYSASIPIWFIATLRQGRDHCFKSWSVNSVMRLYPMKILLIVRHLLK